MRPELIISGGQTGADQGGLEGAKRIGIETGGYMPKGCRTEAGPRPDLLLLYNMKEHPSDLYPPRTRANAELADATVWFGKTNSAGYVCTFNAVERYGKKWLENPTYEQLAQWCIDWKVKILNVAGNRESRNIGLHAKTADTIVSAFGPEMVRETWRKLQSQADREEADL